MKIQFLLVCILFAFTGSFARQANAIAVSASVPEEGKAIVKGKIYAADGSPAAWVNVMLKGTYKGTMTDGNGYFELKNVQAGDYVLVVSLAGLESLEKNITIENNKVLSLQINLKETSRQLESVIVEARRNLADKPVSIGKFAIAPIDLPQAITVIGPAILRDQQAQRLSDVIKT